MKELCSIQVNSKNRVISLDIIRGFIIILILYHHSSAPLSEYVLQFHMPALFLLSGYTECILNVKKTFNEYLKSKFVRLMVPYFCFEIFNLMLHLWINFMLNRETISIGEAIMSIIICTNDPYKGLYGRLWFLPTMFFSSIFAWIIKKLATKTNKIVLPIGTILCGGGRVLCQ